MPSGPLPLRASVADPDALGKGRLHAEFSTRFNDFGFWAVLTAGVTPFPYKVITIMSGWTGMPLATFVSHRSLRAASGFYRCAGCFGCLARPSVTSSKNGWA